MSLIVDKKVLIFSIAVYVSFFADDNECLINNGNCEEKCKNNPGSYECVCKDGYMLQSDKHSCRSTCMVKL